MKTFSLALLALVASQAGTLQDAVALRRTLKADTTDTYKIDTKVQQTVKGPTGDIPMTITSVSTYALKTTKVDDAAGTAVVEATTTMDKLDADGPIGQMLGQQKPQPTTQTGKIDVRGRLTFDKSAGTGLNELMSGAQATASAGTFVEFPEKPVKVGDTWDIVVPKGPMTLDQDQKLTAKLVGEKDLDGTPVWVVAVSGAVKSMVDTSKLPKGTIPDGPMGPMNLVLKGDVTLAGEGLVDKATGKTLQMTTKGETKSTIDLEMGLSIETTGHLDSTIKLVKQ